MKREFDEIQRQLREIEATRQMNFEMIGRCSNYLNHAPDFITKSMMETLTQSCEMTEPEAFTDLFIAACDLKPDECPHDRELVREWVVPAIRGLNDAVWKADPYYQSVLLPEVYADSGSWTLKYEQYKPFEAFVWRDIVLTESLKELPQIGYFTESFRFPAVLEHGREWMTVTPNEIETMRAAIERASGNVAVMGLGLGYYPFMISRKANVSHIDIIEKDPAVIELFERTILPQFPDREKISILEADAFSFAAEVLPVNDYDTVFVDLWHDAADGMALYLRMAQLEQLAPRSEFLYWIEDSLLSRVRWMDFTELTVHPESAGDLLDRDGAADVYAYLDNDSCRRRIRRHSARTI